MTLDDGRAGLSEKLEKLLWIYTWIWVYGLDIYWWHTLA